MFAQSTIILFLPSTCACTLDIGLGREERVVVVWIVGCPSTVGQLVVPRIRVLGGWRRGNKVGDGRGGGDLGGSR